MTDYVTIRVWLETRRLLRLIAADSGEQMVEVMHRLCESEAERRGVVRSSVRSDSAGGAGNVPNSAGSAEK